MAVLFATPSDLLERSTGAFLDNTRDYTVTFWAQPVSALASGDFRTFYQSTNAGFSAGVFVGQADSGVVELYCNTDLGSGFFDALGVAPLADAAWVAFGLTYVAATGAFTLYQAIAGVLTVVAAGVLDFSAIAFTDELLGGEPDSAADTGMAYFREWQAVLSEAEILAELLSPLVIRTADLFTDTPLLSPADLTDASGNGHDWTAVGSVALLAGPFTAAPTRLTQLPLEAAYDFALWRPYIGGGANGWETPVLNPKSSGDIPSL
jgi:hypothetical protein